MEAWGRSSERAGAQGTPPGVKAAQAACAGGDALLMENINDALACQQQSHFLLLRPAWCYCFMECKGAGKGNCQSRLGKM